MGAAYDYMLECERLQRIINKKNKNIREQKKLIAELSQGIVDSIDGVFRPELYDKACKILNKKNDGLE